MPAEASLEDLEKVQNELEALKMKNPEIYEDFVKLFKRNRMIGYRNIAKMLIGEADPKKLKGLESPVPAPRNKHQRKGGLDLSRISFNTTKLY